MTPDRGMTDRRDGPKVFDPPSARGMMAVVLSALFLGMGSSTASAQATRALDCDACHGELELLRQQAPSLEAARRLLVSRGILERSAHPGMACGECHRGFGAYPHPEGRGSTVACADCHATADSSWGSGAHAGSEPTSSASCTSCHGIHDVWTTDRLREDPLRMDGRCAECHSTEELPPSDPHVGEAACHQCHAAHAVRHVNDSASAIAAANQPATCGGCHDEIALRWVTDVHGSAVLAMARGTWQTDAGDESRAPPACTTCHGAHPTVDLSRPEVAGEEVTRCRSCHEGYAETFGDSYHGQATELGSPAVAACADCHTAHAIHPADDPRATVAPGRLVDTCGECHPRANASFVQFQPHADPHDREKNPVLYWAYRFMTALLVGVLGVFGLHALLWLVRSAMGRGRGGAEAVDGGRGGREGREGP